MAEKTYTIKPLEWKDADAHDWCFFPDGSETSTPCTKEANLNKAMLFSSAHNLKRMMAFLEVAQ